MFISPRRILTAFATVIIAVQITTPTFLPKPPLTITKAATCCQAAIATDRTTTAHRVENHAQVVKDVQLASLKTTEATAEHEPSSHQVAQQAQG